MILYGGMLSPFVMRAVLAARFKGHDLTPQMPEGGLKSEGYLKINPVGKMPALSDGDFSLAESEVIAGYLEEALDGPSLLPGDAKARARVRLLSRLVDVYVVPNLGPMFQGAQGEALAKAKEGLEQAFAYLSHFGDFGEHAIGSSYTLADCTLMPALFFMDALDGQFGTAALVAGQPKIAAYWAAQKATPAGQWMVPTMMKALMEFMKQRAAGG